MLCIDQLYMQPWGSGSGIERQNYFVAKQQLKTRLCWVCKGMDGPPVPRDHVRFKGNHRLYQMVL